MAEFIMKAPCNIAYDPFAGAGDLLKAAGALRDFDRKIGFDIDGKLGWPTNDSLLNVPSFENAIIITNPPYIAKQSATRKKIDLSLYFGKSTYDDVYLIALENCIRSQQFVVAIVPESFVNSSFSQKGRLRSITILEENPFDDTENPVCVVCFDDKVKPYGEIKIWCLHS